MRADDADDDETYVVVVNAEQQYSIWPHRLTVPRGWRTTGTEGPRAECLRIIDEVWTDMRPLTLRRAMDG